MTDELMSRYAVGSKAIVLPLNGIQPRRLSSRPVS